MTGITKRWTMGGIADIARSFNWAPIRSEVAPDELIQDGVVVSMTIKRAFRATVRLDDPALLSAVLPLPLLRRRLLIAATEIPLAALETAEGRYERMATFADRRGDVAGADAWRLVVEAIRNAKDIAAKAVAQQTWDVDE